ncbi:MAG: tRNA-dihydrouridine synthase [Exilibacterium sp.]
MRLFLAPMEGVVDHHFRALLTGIGGVDVCVTEFVRVMDHVLPSKVFKLNCPELANQSKTHSGIPVRVQLLGGQPGPVAENAAKAAGLGACGIDLNFGCPARTVNRRDGGACLLREPQRVYNIVHAVRQAVPATVPVTAKIRLGYDDKARYLENAQAVYAGGAQELTVHARTKVEGYKPPAYWEYIADIREHIAIPVIANGEIWSVSDFQRCRQITGCSDFMLGRGLLACPDLALQIKAACGEQTYGPMEWCQVLEHLYDYHCVTARSYPARFLGNRVKQWLSYLRRQYPLAQVFFDRVKRFHQLDEFERVFAECKQFQSRSEVSPARRV